MLNSARTVMPPGWMNDPAVRIVFRALTDTDAMDPEVLFVGGCVRNLLLGLPPGDLDLATVHKPEAVIRRIEGAGATAIPTGIDHGTVTAVVNGKPFEITTLRKDVETDGRRATVAYTHDWRIDAARRDFTMNTLLADLDGNIYDPTGSGLSDLESNRIVFVGDAAQRVAEDHLRILRFFRFYALFGADAPPDADALAACRGGADKIETLSRERVTQEILRILGADRPGDILALMFENGVMRDLVYPGFQETALNALADQQKTYTAIDVAARLSVLADPEADDLVRLEKYIVFSNALRRDVESVRQAVAAGLSMSRRECIYRFGNRAALQSAIIVAAGDGGILLPPDLDILKNWTPPAFPLTGDDVMAAGVGRGPEIGRILKNIEDWWVAQDFRPDRHDCRARIAGALAQS